MNQRVLQQKITKGGLIKLTIIGLFTFLFVGCVSSKKIVYFQDDKTVLVEENILNFEPILQPNDILNINVSSLTPEAAVPYNISDAQGSVNQRPLPYLVNVDGEIDFPGLGTLKVAGLTTKGLTNELIKRLEPFLKDPIITVRLDNFKVTVMGEVKTPGSYTVKNERITILEAIGMAGDLNIQAKRKDITLIREQNGKRVFISMDITSKDIFNSPYFYLAQNDVVYVEPNKTKINSSVVGANTAVVISSLTLLISLTALILR